jgi:uncharacterized phage protein (TIGR01671 family)
MREIKFRAWNTRRKEMEMIDDMYWFEENQCHHNGDNDYVIQQYTGLKDKNEKEIYEGDIIQWSADFRERKAEVKYGIGEFDGGVYKYAGFYLEGDGRILEPYEITYMIKHKEYYSYKVVGNIFEGVDK